MEDKVTREEAYDEFLMLINDAPDFGYELDEFNEWLKDYELDLKKGKNEESNSQH